MPSLSKSFGSEDDGDLRRGPWTLEEDTLLVHYIASHGEGRWNLLAKHAGNLFILTLHFYFLGVHGRFSLNWFKGFLWFYQAWGELGRVADWDGWITWNLMSSVGTLVQKNSCWFWNCILNGVTGIHKPSFIDDLFLLLLLCLILFQVFPTFPDMHLFVMHERFKT